jgi:hypothetical protein
MPKHFTVVALSSLVVAIFPILGLYPRVLIGLSPNTNKQLVIEYLASRVGLVMHPNTIKTSGVSLIRFPLVYFTKL